MKLSTVFAFFIAVVFSMAGARVAHAGEEVKFLEGSMSMLATPQIVRVEFSYDGMLVGDVPESAYVAERVAEKNKDKPGAGDAWLASWTGDREARFHPKFIELMNKGLQGKGTFATSAPDAGYVMRVKVLRTEPGFYSYVVNKAAELDVDITVVAAADPATVLAHATVLRAPGYTSTSFGMTDTGSRIAEAYAKAAKDLAKLLGKHLK